MLSEWLLRRSGGELHLSEPPSWITLQNESPQGLDSLLLSGWTHFSGSEAEIRPPLPTDVAFVHPVLVDPRCICRQAGTCNSLSKSGHQTCQLTQACLGEVPCSKHKMQESSPVTSSKSPELCSVTSVCVCGVCLCAYVICVMSPPYPTFVRTCGVSFSVTPPLPFVCLCVCVGGYC